MIPTLFTGSVLIAPGAGLISSGYVAGNTLAAQNLNWYLYHLTAELNNILTAAGITQNTADDAQLVQAISPRKPSTIAASGTTVAAQFTSDAYVKFTNSTAATYDISAGASRTGIIIIVEATGAGAVTIQTGTGMTASLPAGAVRLIWNGSGWAKLGGAAMRVIFTSGSAATWKTPFAGSYKITLIGGGGGGGAARVTTSGNAAAGGGSGGGTNIKWLYEAAGVTFTYTVGTGGPGGNLGNGTSGNGSSLTDGVGTWVAAAGTGGLFADATSANVVSNGSNGASTGNTGDITFPGGMGGDGVYLSTTAAYVRGGFGGGSFYGGLLRGVSSDPYGHGGDGAIRTTVGNSIGQSGTDGLITIEF